MSKGVVSKKDRSLSLKYSCGIEQDLWRFCHHHKNNMLEVARWSEKEGTHMEQN